MKSKNETQIVASEELMTCPDCGQENFLARGLAGHRGKKACLKRQEENKKALATAHPDVAGCVQRFAMLQGGVRKTVEMLKLLKYFSGLEVHALYALHGELYGETRGGGEGATVEVTLEQFLEDRLKCSARTARKYRNFFLDIAQSDEHAETVTRLNAWWMERGKLMLADAKEGLSLQELSKVTASDLQRIADQPDEWGLHELFAEPEKEEEVAADEVEEVEPPNEKERLIHFWHNLVLKRMHSNEILRLPKPQREAMATAMEEMVSKIKDTLKPAKKKAKAKASAEVEA